MTAPLPDVPTPFEVQAFTALQRATEQARALGATMDEAEHALAEAGLDDFERQLARLIEWRRFIAVRLELLAKRVAGGSP